MVRARNLNGDFITATEAAPWHAELRPLGNVKTWAVWEATGSVCHCTGVRWVFS